MGIGPPDAIRMLHHDVFAADNLPMLKIDLYYCQFLPNSPQPLSYYQQICLFPGSVRPIRKQPVLSFASLVILLPTLSPACQIPQIRCWMSFLQTAHLFDLQLPMPLLMSS